MNTSHKPNTPQSNTVYTSTAAYERDRDARERAGMEQAFARLTAESLADKPVQEAVTPSAALVQDYEPVVPESPISGDVELIRTAVALGMAREAQLWLVLEETARQTGKNYVFKRDLPALLEKHHIQCSGRNLSRWLLKGQHFWIVTPTRVRLIGYNAVAKSLTRAAYAAGLRDLVSTNRPGQRRNMYINVASNTLADFEANVYAAWLASRNNPTISRKALKALFNRDLSVLREWEQLADIQVIENFGHIPTEFSDRVPQNEDGEFRDDVHTYSVNGRTRWKVQLTNTYQAPAVKEHPKRGQSRRVAREVLEIVESDKPAGTNGQGDDTVVTGGLERLDRMYFEDSPKKTAAAKAKSAVQRGKQGDKWLAVGQPHCQKRQHVLAPDGIQRATAAECWPQYAGRVNYA